MSTVPIAHALAQFCAGLALGYLVASVAESFLHKHVHHASAALLRLARRHGRWGEPIVRAHYGHSVIHHGRTFRHSHVEQFESPAEHRALDLRLRASPHGGRVLADHYGLSVSKIGFVWFIAPVVPAYALIVGAAPPWLALGALLPALAYPCASKFLHPYIHMKHSEALRRAGPLMRMLLRTRYVRFIRVHHFLHHKHRTCNFNLLWIGDYLLSAHRAPGADELAEARRIGLIE
jgi:hypothetical protein